METCDALTRLNNIMRKNVSMEEDPLIDITGEEANGGSSSRLFACDKCEYKASIIKNLNDHISAKHDAAQIPSELCKFVSKTPNEYRKHVNDKHPQKENPKNKENEKSSTKSTNNSIKRKDDSNVKIPCDMCDFTSKSADDYIKHIEIKHQKKYESIKEYACDRCDYKGRSEGQFKTHLEVAHKLNVGGFTKVSYEKKSKNLCISWNQGHCTYGQRCRFEHKDFFLF